MIFNQDPNKTSLDDARLISIFGAPFESDNTEAQLGLAALRKNLFAIDDEPIRIAGLEIREVIGQGGMGKVYRAYDAELDRDIALKVLFARGDDEATLERLRNEARTMAKVAHPNIVTIHDVDDSDGRFCLKLELVDGVTLRRWQRDHVADWRAILARHVEAGRGLAAIHRHKIVHGDYKADNVLVAEIDGRAVAKVTDFGLARGLAAEPLADGSYRSYGGTPEYAAPEQLAEGRCDARSDQFSFCVTLYEALCGALPFTRPLDGLRPTTEGELAEATSRARQIIELHGGFRREGLRWPPQARRLPRWLKRALTRGLHPNPEKRFPTMDAVVDAIDLSKRRTSRLLLGGIAVMSLAAAAYAGRLGTLPSCDDATRVAAIWTPKVRTSLDPGTVDLGDNYTETLTATYDEVCREHHAGRLSDAVATVRRSCLDGRLFELEAALATIATEEKLPLTAFGLLDRLRPIDACGAQLDAVEPPGADIEGDVSAARKTLSEAYVKEVSQDFEAARGLTDRALRFAKKTDYLPLRAEAHYQRGRVARHNYLQGSGNTKDRDKSTEFLNLAMGESAFANDRGLSADIVLFAARTDLALTTVDDDEIPSGIGSAAQSLTSVSPRTLDQEGQLAHLRSIRALIDGTREDNPKLLTKAALEASQALSIFESANNAFDQAKLHRTLGDIHRAIGSLHRKRGQSRQLIERLTRADESYRRALDLWRQIEGVGSRNVLAIELRRMSLLFTLGQHEEATALGLRQHKEATAMWSRLETQLAAPEARTREVCSTLVTEANVDSVPVTVAWQLAALALDCKLPPRRRVEALMLAPILALENEAPDKIDTALPWADELVELLNADHSTSPEGLFCAHVYRGRLAVRLGKAGVARESLKEALSVMGEFEADSTRIQQRVDLPDLQKRLRALEERSQDAPAD